MKFFLLDMKPFIPHEKFDFLKIKLLKNKNINREAFEVISLFFKFINYVYLINLFSIRLILN